MRGLYRGFGFTFLGSGPAAVMYFGSYELFKSRLLRHPDMAAAPPALIHAVSGMAAETISCVLWVPIDVVKERLQTQQPARAGGALHAADAPYRGSVHALRTILASEGVRGLYKGYFATLGSFGPYSALYFAFYEQFKSMRRGRSSGPAAAADLSFGEALVGCVVAAARRRRPDVVARGPRLPAD